ncbi:Cyclin-dependent kinase inhibitor 3 (CDKN3) [Arcicella aurantiaca]|uniref:Cyclin-dependent kinase inhibitor 3 (CDKN3) n=1 Tax=Arcicella aurantiaca TaxID=591202 RepID=A0A316E816_9BACT|nr:dual specificity protein phosphatase family protein [Arcicella aurantiaca]PWK26135.1 Cyclin-dependent kinase inhibitor 3 (CDKN3) [Arcicella aurantiaca]
MKTRIFWIEENLGIMSRPLGGDDLQEEIIHWKKLGINTIVSFLTDEENEELDLEYERMDCRREGFEFIKFPIEDGNVPDSYLKTKELVIVLAEKIKDNQKVLLHSRGGIGRTSMIAASILAKNGLSTQKAFDLIIKIRGIKVPDSDIQKNWVEEFVLKMK